MVEPTLPPLPPELSRLRDYLLERDLGPPTGALSPGALTSVAIGLSHRRDVITWDYAQEQPPRGRPADGFIFYASFLDTSDPIESGCVLGLEQRSAMLLVPSGTLVSYAVAPYRLIHSGQERGTKATLPDWQGVTDGAGPGMVGEMRFEVPLAGVQDGSNQLFTVPLTIARDAAGIPMAQLLWRRAVQMYSASDPPPAGRWHLRADQAVITGDAPAAGDYLAFAFLVLG